MNDPAKERAIDSCEEAARFRRGFLLCGAAMAVPFRPDDVNMTEGFFQLETTTVGGQASLPRSRLSGMPERTEYVRTAIGWLPIAVILVAAGWLLTSDHSRKQGTVGAIRAAAATTPVREHATVGTAKNSVASTSARTAPQQSVSVDGLNISSQSWRRGGLGSNALVTLTLRNDNDYAVKDTEISCAFTRPDGTHLTDRTRLIHDTVNSKSRKTFARLHVGFVGVTATDVQCSVIAASHV